MSNVSIRSATLNDLEVLKEFEQGIIDYERPMDVTLRRTPISYYDLEALINSDEAEVTVAEINNEVVGSGYVKIKAAKPYLDHDRYGYIGFMFVKSEYRGQGINKKINDALINWSKAQGLIEVRLEVYDDNASAVRAYEKAGYSKNMVEMRMRL